MTIPAGLTTDDTTVDLLVVGSGTGMAAALTAAEFGLSVLIVEKSGYVGGSTARSGGALWLPGGPVLREAGAGDSEPNNAGRRARPTDRWAGRLLRKTALSRVRARRGRRRRSPTRPPSQ